MPKPLGHRATQQFIGNLTYMYFCGRVACEYFGAYGTRSRVVHVVGFGEGPKFEASVRHLNPWAISVLYWKQFRLLEGFHQCCLRSILGIKWQDYVSNEVVPERTSLPSIESILLQVQLH